MIKLFERGRAGFLRGRQGGPFEEKSRGQWAPEILAAQFQGLREIGFEQTLEAVGQAGALVDDGPTVGD